MPDAIYLRQDDEFVAMTEAPYDAEDVLQTLLAEHPEILAGGDTAATSGGGWVLVRREAGIADADDAGSRWSLDHLFLDARGIPTLVEVKRRSDARARREVVAQMLDYAANATAFWRVELLVTWFEDECQRRDIDPVEALRAAFGVIDSDSYWAAVQTNLAADRIRLVFVGDEIAPELRSIVEFLNRQMRETEVLAIEVKQYVDADGARQTIVPRLVGQTEAARAAKGAVGRGAAPRFDFSSASPAFHELVDRMDAVADDLGLTIKHTRTGRNYQPATPEPGAKDVSGVGVYATERGAEFNLSVFRDLNAGPLADDLLERIRARTGMNITAREWPAVPCAVLTRDWDRTRAEVVEPYFRARDQLARQ